MQALLKSILTILLTGMIIIFIPPLIMGVLFIGGSAIFGDYYTESEKIIIFLMAFLFWIVGFCRARVND